MKHICCYLFLLLSFTFCNKDDDSGTGGGGGNNDCVWEKNSSKIEVISATMGTECGNSAMSVAVTVKNVSEEKLRLAICFEQFDDTWVGQTDHILEPGETKKLSICDYGAGGYKYWVIKFDGTANCEVPSCTQ